MPEPKTKPAAAGNAMELYQGKQCPVAIPETWEKGPLVGAFVTSLNLQTKEGRRKALLAVDGDIPMLADLVNTPVKLLGYTLCPVDCPDEDTGEVERAVKCVLHHEDGDAWCISAGVLKSLGLIAGVYGGPAPWNPPIEVVPRRVATKGGRSRYFLEVVS